MRIVAWPSISTNEDKTLPALPAGSRKFSCPGCGAEYAAIPTKGDEIVPGVPLPVAFACKAKGCAYAASMAIA